MMNSNEMNMGKSGDGNTMQGQRMGGVPQQKDSRESKPIAEKGLGYFPISDMQFDVITLIYEKSKALQAYDSYVRDAQANKELSDVIEQIRMDDRKHVEMLKNFLGNV
jgi:hypothetical protein